MPSMLAARDAQASRLAELGRAFKRQLPRRLTVAEKHCMDRAVRLTFRAEQAALDPKVCANNVVRLDNAATRARGAWQRLIAAYSLTTARTPLRELLEREAQHGQN